MAEQKKNNRPLSSNEQEIETLKGAFAENDALLKALRKLFFGAKLNKSESELIRTSLANQNVRLALRRKLYALEDFDAPIGEFQNKWFGTDTEIIGKDTNTIEQVVKSKQFVLGLLDKAFDLLDDPQKGSIDITILPLDKDPYQISLLARNKFISAVETGLTIVKVIAGQKKETPEQALKRLMDSSK